MGYVLPFGQMSFWGATVITNLLSPFPSLRELLCGGYYVYNPTLKRFFLFHFQFPFLICGFIIIHLFYLHFLSSNNPLRNTINNKIPFFPYIFSKDFYAFTYILSLFPFLFSFLHERKRNHGKESIMDSSFLSLRVFAKQRQDWSYNSWTVNQEAIEPQQFLFHLDAAVGQVKDYEGKETKESTLSLRPVTFLAVL